MRALIVALLVAGCVALVAGDCYMHNPRGSNDRNREANTNRNNANRLFDSQNNAKGGYAWGPAMTFYAGSRLTIEWTSQHGCGKNPRMYCNIVLQYMCEDKDADDFHKVRDGTTTDTIPNDNSGPTQMDGDDYVFGMHEPYEYYKACETRSRNLGLWIADREEEGGLTPGRAAARFTRQNNNGNRHGYECPEERDYYPYWSWSPWRDIAILTHDTDWCGFYRSESQNKKDRFHCWDENTDSPAAPITESACEALGSGFDWKKKDSWGIPPPKCVQAPIARENHLGHGSELHNNMYNWTLPSEDEESCIKDNNCDCVLRIRYNISTADLGENGNRPDKKFIDYTSNAGNSPIYDDEIVTVDGLDFYLAIDTTQYGRTFEDRSHVFHINSRPSDVPSNSRIFNLNVRGKRGNIVQTYPSTEYDFSPKSLMVRQSDYIHFQWTGSDFNPAGNAGEGTQGTDRHNIVQTQGPGYNYPADDKWLGDNNKLFGDEKTRKRMAYLDQTNCLSYEELLANNGNNQNAAEQDVQNCMLLNAADPYFDGGLQKMTNTGHFYFISTRNNNHSNRDQKGDVVVDPLLPIWAVALLVVGSVLFLGSAGVAGAMYYAKGHPHSQVANILAKF